MNDSGALPTRIGQMMVSAYSRLSYLLGVICSFSVIRLFGLPIFLVVLALMLVLLVTSLSLRVEGYRSLLIMLFTLLVSSVVCLCSDIPDGYKQSSTLAAVTLLAIYLVYCSIGTNGLSCTLDFVNGAIIGFRIQVVWIILQTIIWNTLSIDLNDLLFNQLFGMVDQASQFKGSRYIPTGLCWNAGGMVAILIFGILFDENLLWKLGGVAGCVFTQSSTAMIGVICIVLYWAYTNFIKYYPHRFKRATLVVACVSIASILTFLVLFPGFFEAVQYYLGYFSERIAQLLFESEGIDSSASAHLSYYQNLPIVFSIMTAAQRLFGFGLDCSGYIYSLVTGQYASVASWAVEADPINLILSTGIVGTIATYFWMFSMTVKCRNSSGKASALVITIIIMGIFYNLIFVTYCWLVLLLLCVCDVCSSRMADSRQNGCCAKTIH